MNQSCEVFKADQRIELFRNVVITDDEYGVRFDTPERIVDSQLYGSFALRVYGELRYFKEHDDYGEIRFLHQAGEISDAIWLPHLYPFESVDADTNLPTIVDRERCSFIVSLGRIEDGPKPAPYPREIAIHSSQGIFAALPDMGSFDSEEDYYTEFHWVEHGAIAQRVEWPSDEPPSVTDFLGELLATDVGRYNRILSGEEELPKAFEKSHEPLDFRTRLTWVNETGLQATGSIWVPVEELRRGIDADIEFVMFDDSNLPSEFSFP